MTRDGLDVWWLALCAALAAGLGCAEPTVVTCDDGRLCPGGSVCTPRGCSLPGVCGDGMLDEGETCDDGNRLNGDDCSATCRVIECNNGQLDPGEECDDGNASSHDGCSSGCKIELAVWRPSSGQLPRPLADASAVWIPDRGRALMFGGTDDTSARSEAWWWMGDAWTPAPAGPPALVGSGMAWDGAGRVVLFGGTRGPQPGSPTAECWVFGSAWTPCSGPRAPARDYPALATGRTPGEVVLFGGIGLGDGLRTWAFGSAGWTDTGLVGSSQRAPFPNMARDPRANEVILVGTVLVTPVTWHLDENGWRSTPDVLQTRDRGTLDFVADRGEIVSFGGSDDFSGVHNDATALTETGWVEVAVGRRPPVRRGHIAFYDPLQHGLVISGGRSDTSGPLRGDTWILRWESSTLDETCDGTSDADDDRLVGCADPDCWGRCDPRCPPRVTSCAADRPRCGDGSCNPDLETAALCPEDCP